MIIIKPSASFRQHYNEIAELCKSSGDPLYLTKIGKGDLVDMDIEVFSRREKMLKLREELLAIQKDRLAGRAGVTPDELDLELDFIINEAQHGKNATL
ncbi:prevent-host-death protein [Paenibacillus pasadenensis]|uniref:prevent-host-death protein n=1 Tax=Paenibacillus pasadenensis TaxID=217090 RepID=UPI00203B2B90|nr:prevent-host-death protein [Paenibacillus pasadenensis]